MYETRQDKSRSGCSEQWGQVWWISGVKCSPEKVLGLFLNMASEFQMVAAATANAMSAQAQCLVVVMMGVKRWACIDGEGSPALVGRVYWEFYQSWLEYSSSQLRCCYYCVKSRALLCHCRSQSGCWSTGTPRRRPCTLTTSLRGSSGRNWGCRAGTERWARKHTGYTTHTWFYIPAGPIFSTKGNGSIHMPTGYDINSSISHSDIYSAFLCDHHAWTFSCGLTVWTAVHGRMRHV